MSTLTKICVVLLVLLALVASVVFIQEAGSKTKWRAYAPNQRSRANLAETNVVYHQMAEEHLNRLYTEAVKGARKAAETYQVKLANNSTQIAQLSGQVAELQSRLNEVDALNRALQGTIDAQVHQNKELIAQLEGQRTRNIDLADQLRSAQDKINEYGTSLESAEKQAEFLQEQLTIREAEVDELTRLVKKLHQDLALRRQGSGMETGPIGPVTALGPRIDGEVLAVQGELASLNVGRASGVKKGMEFKIYRDAEFIAHLKVEEVYPSTCAGVLENRVGEVKKGDKASTRLDTE
ncbi:MAG: hypothetical protein ACYS5V_11865 [Planctomycetota bacterium]